MNQQNQLNGAIFGIGGWLHAEYRDGVAYASDAMLNELYALTETGREIRFVLSALNVGQLHKADDLPRWCQFLN